MSATTSARQMLRKIRVCLNLVDRKKLRPRLKKFSVQGLAALLLFVALSFCFIPSPAENIRDFASSPIKAAGERSVYKVSLSANGEWLVPVPLEDMSPWLVKVALGIEDKRFYEHRGVDPRAMIRALGQNVFHTRRLSGGSTITMQLIKVTHPRPRNAVSKYLEMVQAVKLERAMGKKEILEHYLNRAPFGGRVRGVEAAARLYFNKGAEALTLGESALLIGVLNGPAIFRPDKHPERARKRRDFLLRLLRKDGVISEEEHKAARAEPVPGGGLMPERDWTFSAAYCPNP